MKIPQLKNKKILILGFGREGMSSYRYIRRHFRTLEIAIGDDKGLNGFEGEYKKVLKKDKYLKLYLNKKYLKVIDKFEVVIKTPGIKLSDKLVKKLKKAGVVLTSNLNIFLANTNGKVIGVTGSKGKGTVATLIYKILKASGKKVYLIGNIGKPFLDYVVNDERVIYVAELSSFHLEMMKEKIDVGLMTSFFPEHLKEHGSEKEYFKAKMNIVNGLKKNGVVIYNKNYKKVEKYIKSRKVKSIPYNKPKIKVETKLLGDHNLENIAGAIEVAKLFKIKDKVILKTIKNFKGLPYRLEYTGKYRGISFYCDTLGTTPETTVKALQALKPKKLETVIIGGVEKGGDYMILARGIMKSKIRTLIMMPGVGVKTGNLIKKIRSGYKPEMVGAKNMKEAVEKSYKLTEKGESVVLSPAGASFDQYKDYAAKGDDFKRLVRKYK